MPAVAYLVCEAVEYVMPPQLGDDADGLDVRGWGCGLVLDAEAVELRAEPEERELLGLQQGVCLVMIPAERKDDID